ncbi:MAG: hypothetical protein ACQEP1_06380 [Nanobdellota archaeon]
MEGIVMFRKKLADHIDELDKEGKLPENWHWHRKEINDLEKIDKSIIKDLKRLHDDIDRKYAERLLNDLRRLDSSEGKNLPEQRKEAEQVNELIKHLKDRLSSGPYIREKFVEPVEKYLKMFSEDHVNKKASVTQDSPFSEKKKLARRMMKEEIPLVDFMIRNKRILQEKVDNYLISLPDQLSEILKEEARALLNDDAYTYRQYYNREVSINEDMKRKYPRVPKDSLLDKVKGKILPPIASLAIIIGILASVADGVNAQETVRLDSVTGNIGEVEVKGQDYPVYLNQSDIEEMRKEAHSRGLEEEFEKAVSNHKLLKDILLKSSTLNLEKGYKSGGGGDLNDYMMEFLNQSKGERLGIDFEKRKLVNDYRPEVIVPFLFDEEAINLVELLNDNGIHTDIDLKVLLNDRDKLTSYKGIAKRLSRLDKLPAGYNVDLDNIDEHSYQNAEKFLSHVKGKLIRYSDDIVDNLFSLSGKNFMEEFLQEFEKRFSKISPDEAALIISKAKLWILNQGTEIGNVDRVLNKVEVERPSDLFNVILHSRMIEQENLYPVIKCFEIINFDRYDHDVLKDLADKCNSEGVVYDTLEKKHDKNALALFSKADHQGTFSVHKVGLDNITSRYNTTVFEVGSEKSLYERIKDYNGKIDMLLLGAHGKQDLITLGFSDKADKADYKDIKIDELKYLDFTDDEIEELREKFSDDAQIVLHSCLTGMGEDEEANMVNFLAKKLGVVVHGPTESMQGTKIRFEKGGVLVEYGDVGGDVSAYTSGK